MLRPVLLLVLVGIGAYGLTRAFPLLTGPSLALATPGADAAYPDGIVSVSGVARRAALLTVNGAPVLHLANGSFEKSFAFPHGGSILTITATDRFGRTVTETRSIFVP